MKVRLKNDLSGYPAPFDYAGRKTIPAGTDVLVENYNHTLTEAKVLWDGVAFVVDRESLEILEDHD
jgi:hypothetical protein